MYCYKVANRYETEIVHVTSRKKAITEVERMLKGKPDGAFIDTDEGAVFVSDTQLQHMLKGYFGEDRHVFAIGTKSGYYNNSVSVTTIKIK